MPAHVPINLIDRVLRLTGLARAHIGVPTMSWSTSLHFNRERNAGQADASIGGSSKEECPRHAQGKEVVEGLKEAVDSACSYSPHRPKSRAQTAPQRLGRLTRRCTLGIGHPKLTSLLLSCSKNPFNYSKRARTYILSISFLSRVLRVRPPVKISSRTSPSFFLCINHRNRRFPTRAEHSCPDSHLYGIRKRSSSENYRAPNLPTPRPC
jgi:hypothetical protein